MNKFDLRITDASKDICRILLYSEQTVPLNSLFRDDLFDKTCRKIQDENEARAIQDISLTMTAPNQIHIRRRESRN